MKILHILNTPRAEGTPRLVLDWLTQTHVTQEVFTLHHSPPDLTVQLKSASAWYGESNLLSFGKSKFLRMVQTTAAICRERKPDIVIIWVAGFSNFISLGCRLAGVKKIIAHAGNPSAQGWSASLQCSFVVAPLALLGTHMVCCSDYVRHSIECASYLLPRMSTIWNCTQGYKFATRAQAVRATRSSRDYQVGLMVATLEDHKDHFTLLEAMSLIHAELSHFKLRIVGDGSLRDQVANKIKALGLEDIVEVLGSRSDVPELMGDSDLFIFSTTAQEGLGSVLLEAMAAELPIIASDVPACREILQGGARGFLVPPKDPQALAEKIVAVLSQPPSTETLKENCEFSCRFTPERMLQSYLSLFAES